MMQKKVEKLPGLSNVSGKYTKKYSTDSFPHTSMLSKPGSTPTSNQALAASEEKCKPLSQEKSGVIPHQPVSQRVSKSSAPVHQKVSFTRPQLRRGSHLLPSSAQHTTALSSPSWPSSLSTANIESRMLSTITPTKSVVTAKRINKNAEMVKSSSSGSVVSLSQKPTGIILAMPSNPPNNLKPLSRFHYTNKNVAHSGDSELTRQQGPSTPYPIRQTHFASNNRVHAIRNREEDFSAERDMNVESAVNNRPSLLVRPVNKVHCPESEISSDVMDSGSHSNTIAVQPNCDSDDCSSDQTCPRSSSWQISYGQFHSANCILPESSSLMPGPKNLCSSSSRSIPSSVFNTPPNSEPRHGFMGVAPVHSVSDSDYADHQTGSVLSPTVRLRTSNTRLYGAQPRHMSSGSVQPSIPSSCKTPLPGPQYTQFALEQCLSDLLAGEQLAWTASSLPNPNSHYFPVSNSNLAGSKDSLDSLRFLHRRIADALEGVHSDYSASMDNHSVSSRAQSTFHVSRSANNCHALSNTRELSDQSTRQGIIEQFNEGELRYLLNAVEELIALRSQMWSPDTPNEDTTSAAKSVPFALNKSGSFDKPVDSRLSQKVKIPDSSHGSRTSSRSSSSIRTGDRFVEVSASEDRRISDSGSFSTSVGDHDSSATDMMHKRLPLGFQHFKRYLDNKFGPDYNGHHQSQRRHPLHSLADKYTFSSHIPDSSIASKQTPIDDEFGRAVPRPSDAYLHSPSVQDPEYSDSHIFDLPSYHNLEDFDRNLVGRRASLSRSFEAGVHRTTYAERSACDMVTPECSYVNSAAAGVPVSQTVRSIAGSCFSYTSPSLASHESPSPVLVSEHQQHADVPSHIACIAPFHQRSYCSTPEVQDNHGLSQSRWSYAPQFYYWWSPYPPPEHANHHCVAHSLTTHPRTPISPSSSYLLYPSQDFCPCGSEHQQTCFPTLWSRTQHLGSSTAPGSTFRFGDTANRASDYFLGPAFACSPHCISPSDEASHGVSADSTQCQLGLSCSVCSGRPHGASSFYRGFPRLIPLSASPTTDWALWATPNSRLPVYHSNLFSPFHTRMPRSGSAGAGFGCGMDAAFGTGGTNSGTPAVCPYQRTVREHSVGPEHASYLHESHSEQQPTQPITRSTHCFGNPFPHLGSSSIGAPVPRPMSNSFSVNDLSGYRSSKLSSKMIRSSRSSFELAPDLPYEPTLALSDCSDFYAKLSAFVEIDNSLQLSVPSGWCERRSSLGRSYYTCDQTKQASWHHPTFGLLVPLGWERVDSYQHGVYYQHLLIPHCQRYHPNLWMPGPLKDPAVEHENFFSDLRYLQSSMRHNLSLNCPDLETFKHTNSASEERSFLKSFRSLDVESMVEVTRGLDQLFYRELHALIVFFEQERMRIVSAMFAFDQCDTIFSLPTDT